MNQSYKNQRPSYTVSQRRSLMKLFKITNISFQVPRRNWIRRNPRVFQITVITTFLLAFYSKPIYDIFIRDDYILVPPKQLKPEA